MKIEEIPQYSTAIQILENSALTNQQIHHSKKVAEILLQHDESERLALLGLLHALTQPEALEAVRKLDLTEREQTALIRLTMPCRDWRQRMQYISRNGLSYQVKVRCLRHRCRHATDAAERDHCSEMLSILEQCRESVLRHGKPFTR